MKQPDKDISLTASLLLVCSLIVALSLTTARGLVWPNDWAEAHWLLSYRFGSLKRALPGTVLSPLFDLPFVNTEWAIGIISGFAFIVFIAALLGICLRTISNSAYSPQTVWIALLFLTSPYVVMSANLIGYFDNIILLFAIVACYFVHTRQPLLGSFVLATGIFIHENIILIGIPSVVFHSLVCHVKQVENNGGGWGLARFIRRNASIIILPILAFLTLIYFQTVRLDTQQFVQSYREHLLAHPFIINNGSNLVPQLLAKSYFLFLDEQRLLLVGRLLNRDYLFRIMPTVSLLLFYSWRRLHGIGRRPLIMLALVSITLLPLSLHAIAFDTNRIWSYPLIVLILGIASICEVFPTTRVSSSLVFKAVAFAIVLSQLQMITPLMGQFIERFTLNQRLLLYAPSIFGVLLFTSKHYRNKSVET